MAAESTLVRLQAEFDNSPESIHAVAALLEAGANPHFISHYRRDETGDLGEARIFEIAERLSFLDDLETRKQAIRQQAEERGQLTPQLEKTLVECFDQDLLDDIYQTFRPSRRTPGVQARERGLGDLADAILAGKLETPLPEAADARIDAEQDLPTREAVLEGVLHILSEQLAADPVLRSRMRKELAGGTLTSKVKAENAKNASRYKSYFDYEQPVRRVQGNHLLNIYRGERDGVLEVSISMPVEKATAIIRKHARLGTPADPVLAQFLDLTLEHTYSYLLRPACEGDVRHQIKERVDRATTQTLARNLRSQLMSPPLGHEKTLGLRASRKTVWAALIADDGSVTVHHTLNLDTDEKRQEALATLAKLLDEHKPHGIALPHGRHQEVSAEVVTAVLAQCACDPIVVPVDEAASAIHATGLSARKEWPGVEVGVRTAISLASRLQDSMHELLSLDPKALSLGQALDEVHQGMLTRVLDETISSCVAKVGMDVNRATASHLARVPGLTHEHGRKIVEHRKRHGSYKNRLELRAADVLDEETFRQCAGFLRVFGGDQRLDETAIHPADYGIVEAIAAAEGKQLEELLGHRAKVAVEDLAKDDTGPLRVKDILIDLHRHGQDVRGRLHKVRNEGVTSPSDLRPDMELSGRITNLTDFGAFVDLGVHQDGLVHISQIPANRLRDQHRMLSVGEVVTVYVNQVDEEKNRISLTMHKPRHLVEGRQPTLGERMQGGGGGNRRGRRGAGREAETAQPFSRAARAPEGRRRGGMRAGPRPKTGEGRGGGASFGGGGGGGRGRGRDSGPRGGTPRVITVDSGRPVEESRGHKGELTSLSSLANLLGGGKKPAEEPKTPPPEAAAPQQPAPPQADPQPQPPEASDGASES